MSRRTRRLWLVLLAVPLLASCGARSGQVTPPLANPFVAGPSRSFYGSPAERENSFCSGYVFILVPPAAIIEVSQDLPFDARLYKRHRQRTYCFLKFVGLTPAHWSSTGGSLKVETGREQAQFSAVKVGTYMVAAKTLKYGTEKTKVVVQVNNEKVLSNFQCTECGSVPTGLVLDSDGTFYGTTQLGGNVSSQECSPPQGCGTVFKLVRGQSGYVTQTLYAFQGGSDGSGPLGGVAVGKDGALFGTTPYGGRYGRGTVFKLTRHGSSYTKSIAHNFRGGSDGAVPLAGLVAGKVGQFYGTTQAGGGTRHIPPCEFYIPGCGTVYELSPRGSGYSERVLYAFKTKGDGAAPFSGLTVGGGGDLYGTTYYGGGHEDGTVFRLTHHGSAYVETFRYSFQGGSDGDNPGASLALDSSNALYGTTFQGGTSNGGTVFKLTPAGKSYRETILYRFNGSPDGAGPSAGVTIGPSGILYGTTAHGGAAYLCDYFRYSDLRSATVGSGCGIAFSLKRNGSSYIKHVLHLFGGDNLDGGGPNGLILDAQGALYGDTTWGGSLNTGTVFKIKP